MTDADKIAAFDRIVALARPVLLGQTRDSEGFEYDVLKIARPFCSLPPQALQAVSEKEAKIVYSLVLTQHVNHDLYRCAVIDLDSRYFCSCGQRFRFAPGVVENRL